MKAFEWEDYEGDALEVTACNSAGIGWCIYAYATEAEHKARVLDMHGVKVICAQEVGIALPLKEAVRLRDYLTRAIAFCEEKQKEPAP
jgi:hypothetical protein